MNVFMRFDKEVENRLIQESKAGDVMSPDKRKII